MFIRNLNFVREIGNLLTVIHRQVWNSSILVWRVTSVFVSVRDVGSTELLRNVGLI